MNPAKYGNLPAATIRISREELKRILLEKAEMKQTVFKWGWACMRAEQTGDGTMQVTVSNDGGKTTSFEQCDLLVAADGANSKLRSLLPTTRYEDHLYGSKSDWWHRLL